MTTSDPAVITVTALPVKPTVLSQPVRETAVEENQKVTFSITVDGTQPITFQWQRNGVDIADANASSYTTPPLTPADSQVSYRCLVKNVAGEVFSDEALISVKIHMASSGGFQVSEGEVKVQGGADGYINPARQEEAILFFHSAQAGSARWTIYNRMGQEVYSASKDAQGGTTDNLRWNGRDSAGSRVSPGLYIFTMSAPGIRKTGKLIVID